MLDYFGIFTRGGALLWTLQFTTLRHNPVEALNALVRGCLLEERLSDTSYSYTPKQGGYPQTLKWSFHNGLGLIFVAVYQKGLSLLYVDELLQSVKAEFVSEYKPHVYSYRKFDDNFKRLLSEAEAKADISKRPGAGGAGTAPSVAFKKGSKGLRGVKGSSAPSGGSDGSAGGDDDDTAVAAAAYKAAAGSYSSGRAHGAGGANTDSALSDSTGQDDVDTNNESDSGPRPTAFDKSKLPKGVRVGRGGPSGRGRGPPGLPAASAPKAGEDSKAKKSDVPKKKPRNWNVSSKAGEGSTLRLDYTDYAPEGGGDTTNAADAAASGYHVPASSGTVQSRMDVEEEEVLSSEGEEEEEEQGFIDGQVGRPGAPVGAGGDKKKGLLSSFMSSLALRVVGSAALAAEDLAPALAEMKRKLMERNVAEEIAQQICDSVGTRLEGQKLSSFTGIKSFVHTAFEESLAGILNKRQVDVLLDIQRSQARQKPYVIVFCGVNGVGKSTNLAKIAYWLLQHNIKVTIAACDTFRAGAVEQLKTHCARLGVPLYERGYEKDPAKVAAEAIRQAERDGNHVVLVDTAGRMQDNEPLMRALSTLINVNEPNLVLFVGEALVGNDAVDQLNKFNRALADLAPVGSTRKHLVDGIVLTKFDTIDEKVGAALSMVYTAGAPVMFVGCGQTYVDLKKLNVKSVVRSLLK